MNLNHHFVNGNNSAYTGEATRKRKPEGFNQDPSMSMTISSDPRNRVQKSGETAGFRTMSPTFDKSQTEQSLRNGIQMKHNSQFILPGGSESQSGGYTWKDMHVSSVSLTGDNEIQKSNVTPPEPPTLQSKGPSPIGTPAVIEIPRLPFSRHFTYNVAAQIKFRACQPNSTDASVITQKEQAKVIPALQHSVRNHLIDVKDSGKTHLTVAPTSPRGTCGSVKDEIRPPSGLSKCISEHVPQDHISIKEEHDARVRETMLKPESTATPFVRTLGGKQMVEMIGLDGCCQSHSRETSGQIGHSLASTTMQLYSNQPSALVDEGKPATRNMNPSTAGKLWDGTLQLSTSTTVSAIAFFKSGEKASEINWSQCIEVKGKVRLEAFEKFIQELPRSRSRALMVISLCWKVGSPETGLTSMKEIAKTYREGQKVGYAQLSPGADLYVCPRSDTIITILAKYGFFKGMAAIEENQDSLIGCVVWRRSFAPSNAKAIETKKLSLEKSSNPPAVECGRQAAEPVSTVAITHESEESESILRTEGNTRKPSPVQPMAIIVSENKAMPTLDSSITPTLMVNSTDNRSMNSVLATSGVQVKYDATFSPTVLPAGGPTLYASASRKSDLDVNVKKPLLRVELPQGPQNKGNVSDDDDLPEFDFVAACGTPRVLKGEMSRSTEQTSLTVVHHNKQLKVEQGVGLCDTSKMSRKIEGLHLPSSLPVIDISTIPGKVVDHFSEKVIAQRTEVLRRSTGKRERDISPAQGFNFRSHQKKIWDDGDDDDMPEWCPPDMDIGNSPSSPPPMLPHRSFYPPDLKRPDPQPPPLPPAATTNSQFPQHQQSCEHYQERALYLPPEPSRSPMRDYHPASDSGFSQQQHAMSKYSPVVDHRHQTLMPHIPFGYCQSSVDSQPWSPSFQNRVKSSKEHDQMSLLDRKFSADQCGWINSAGNVSGKLPGNRLYGKSGGKRDRCYEQYQNETSRRRHGDLDMKFEYRDYPPKHKESSRRRPTGFDVLPSRPTGFDVLPNSPRPTHGHARDQYPRRRPSQFDDKPRERTDHSRR